ncbi:MAG: CDP-diacylglycerol--glycerol-3-phosphate 3-phosphatidyltransferase [Proteobacteria bacterium]|nr:CDP-diacylglycerol--glycerol-3-phosphate 3-phosphatidyltransferase [Pseudomonadota bacterium]MBU1709715.1 CDP-diacylglycerol--glycerol-3-phosphate 3-phosphatidyltransferase [Pseudomonadota bacterium]
MHAQKKILTLPNLLTGFRFAVVPVLMFCFQPEAGIATSLFAFFLFLSAALTDLADGYFARKQKSETVLGKLMDPVADKVLVASALIMLIPMDRIPAWASFIIISRELVITGLRGVAASSGIVISASRLGKIKSVSQYTALCILIFPLGFLPLPFLHDLGLIVLYISVALTIWSGIEYFMKFQKVFLDPSKS